MTSYRESLCIFELNHGLIGLIFRKVTYFLLVKSNIASIKNIKKNSKLFDLSHLFSFKSLKLIIISSNIFSIQRPNLKNMSRSLNLSRGSNSTGSTKNRI